MWGICLRQIVRTQYSGEYLQTIVSIQVRKQEETSTHIDEQATFFYLVRDLFILTGRPAGLVDLINHPFERRVVWVNNLRHKAGFPIQVTYHNHSMMLWPATLRFGRRDHRHLFSWELLAALRMVRYQTLEIKAYHQIPLIGTLFIREHTSSRACHERRPAKVCAIVV